MASLTTESEDDDDDESYWPEDMPILQRKIYLDNRNRHALHTLAVACLAQRSVPAEEPPKANFECSKSHLSDTERESHDCILPAKENSTLPRFVLDKPQRILVPGTTSTCTPTTCTPTNCTPTNCTPTKTSGDEAIASKEKEKKTANKVQEPIKKRKYKRRRRSRATKAGIPSKYCHVCTRSSVTTKTMVCSNVKKETCRKIICIVCAADFEWQELYNALSTNVALSAWTCAHCRGICPARAQCHTYNRINGTRGAKGARVENEHSQ